MSYGEGWKNGYHVYRTASRNGVEYVDKGTVGGYKIGDTVGFVYNGIENAGKIEEARVSPVRNGSRDVSFTIKDSSGEDFSIKQKNVTGKVSKKQAQSKSQAARNAYDRSEFAYARNYSRTHEGKLPPSYYNSDGRIKAKYRDFARSVRGY